MISISERTYITEHAYVPEHLPDYVSAISGTELHLFGEFVIHMRGNHLILIGYPLSGDWNETQLINTLEQAQTRFDPTFLSVITPEIPAGFDDWDMLSEDAYYRLDLSQLIFPKKVRHMLRRAQREVTISGGQFGREHKHLLRFFLRRSTFDPATKFIFQRLPEYIEDDSVCLYEARNARGELVAFDVAEFGARNYAFYMFNIRSGKHNIPGVSDLLLSHIIERAQAREKRYLNLGLGIHSGIEFFKMKWGGEVFLKYFNISRKALETASLWDGIDSLLGT